MLIVLIMSCYCFWFEFLLKIQATELCTEKYSESEIIKSPLPISSMKDNGPHQRAAEPAQEGFYSRNWAAMESNELS